MAAVVLIVEDQMLIAWHLNDLIEGAGHRVLAIARDPAEAVAAAAKEQPDLALMDIRLHGGTSGLDAARMLFERWAVRCVFLSANLDPVTRAQAETFQPLGFIGKPFLPGDVIEAVERAVKALSSSC